MSQYHYLLRSYRRVIPGDWSERILYKDYILYKSIPFDTIMEMRDDYARQIHKYYLDPNPQFFYNNHYMRNSDAVYYKLDEVDIGDSGDLISGRKLLNY